MIVAHKRNGVKQASAHSRGFFISIMKKLNLPTRVSFPKIKIIFPQTNPPLGHDTKMRLRSYAKRNALYRIPVEVNPLVTGRNDAGEEIAIDTLGKWLFGVPGYKGHINVLPYEEEIVIEVCTDLPEAIELLTDAASKLGLKEWRVERVSIKIK